MQHVVSLSVPYMHDQLFFKSQEKFNTKVVQAAMFLFEIELKFITITITIVVTLEMVTKHRCVPCISTLRAHPNLNYSNQ